MSLTRVWRPTTLHREGGGAGTLTKQLLARFCTSVSLRAVGVGFSRMGKRHSAACQPPTPTLGLQGKCPLCAAHTAYCTVARIQVGAELHSPRRAWHCPAPLAEHTCLHIHMCVHPTHQGPQPTHHSQWVHGPAPGPSLPSHSCCDNGRVA